MGRSFVRDDWDDDDADLPDEEDPKKLWEEANARAPMPQVVIAGSSTSNAAALSPPPAALQPVMRILKRPSASPSSSASSPGSSSANDPSTSKSYAEREARYQAARERIFGGSQPAADATDAQQSEGGANARSAANATPVRITREPKGPPSGTATQKGPDHGADAPSPGLTALEYCLNKRDSRFDSEDQALALILRTFHTTLRKLDLPIELALIEPLRSLEWPALQELRFHGEPNTDDARFSLSDNMRVLRTLDLALSVSSDYTPTPLWLSTPSRPGDFPCRDLQRLAIAFPCVTDALWACLPPTLRELSLVCYPHTNLGTDLESLSDLDWGQTIPRASGLLKVLRMCDLPTLRVLGVAYIEDDDERHLLRLIGTRFSTLEELVIVRYAHERRGSNQAIASAEDFIKALVCAPGLRIVSLHMDLPDCPRPSRRRARGRRRSGYCPYEIENFKEQTLDVAADGLARTLPASATTVRFLLPRYDGLNWLEYGIVRSDQGTRAVRLP
ncbi:hypothetical protein ACG7TL_001851 [Trametes sanguinea]